jgi:hypothetical protein
VVEIPPWTNKFGRTTYRWRKCNEFPKGHSRDANLWPTSLYPAAPSECSLSRIITHDFKVRRFVIQLQMGVKIRCGPFCTKSTKWCKSRWWRLVLIFNLQNH